MILGRSEIKRLVDSVNLIENFSIDCLGGAGYDLRVNRVYTIKSDAFLGVKDRKTPEIEELQSKEYTLAANQYVLVETLEKVNMPPNILARILPRSSIFRSGCALITAVVDPGFKGTLTFGLKNLTEHKFRLEQGARIAQIVFEKVEGETTLYNGKYQGGKIV